MNADKAVISSFFQRIPRNHWFLNLSFQEIQVDPQPNPSPSSDFQQKPNIMSKSYINQ